MAAKNFQLSYDDITIPGYYPASRTALLLLDYHVSFVKKQGGVSAPAALSVAADFTHWARTQGIEVIHCPVDLTLSPFPTCKGSARFASIVEALRAEGGGGEEAPELAATVVNDEKVFAKRPGHVSSLKAEGLENYLRDKGIASLLMAGLSTSGCVLRTAVAACDAEFVVTVIEDACADPVEGVHDFTCKHLLTNRGYVVTAKQFKEWFGKTGQQSDLD